MPSKLLRTASGRDITQRQHKAVTRPSYKKLLIKALAELNKKGLPSHATSIPAIVKWIENNYKLKNAKIAGQFVRREARKAVERNEIRQVRQSFILKAAAKKKREIKKKSKVVRKVREISKETSTKKPVQRSPESSPSSDQTDTPAKQNRRVRDTSTTASTTPKTAPAGVTFDHFWQYEHNGWKNYDGKASDVVEGVYQSYLVNRGGTDVRAVKSGEWEYLVDFQQMKQTNIQHEAHTIRNIRRVAASK